MASTPPLEKKYDVFLSFRGADTRDNFASHLYAALIQSNIETYVDNRLERGDAILPALQRAVEASKLSVIIFSENYASSSWCLDELVHILDCKEANQLIVVPVFYKIDPSSVRKQTGRVRAAFYEHETRFRNEIGKVQRWRKALEEATNLSGWDSTVTRPESVLVDAVVQDIVKKLRSISPGNNSKSLVRPFIRLRTDSRDVHIRDHWGRGGIDADHGRGYNPDPEEVLFMNGLVLDRNRFHNSMGVPVASTCLRPVPLYEFNQVSVCYQGDEIPSWFSYQSMGSSLNIKLSPGWFKESFVGFALCIVAAFRDKRVFGSINFQCESEFKSVGGKCYQNTDLRTFCRDVNLPSTYDDSDRTFLWYDFGLNNFTNRGDGGLSAATEASFEFFPIYMAYNFYEPWWYVKRCGVSFLYAPERGTGKRPHKPSQTKRNEIILIPDESNQKEKEELPPFLKFLLPCLCK